MRYYDDLELRQSVEKQLSHIKMMNRFAKAVFFGNNQKFQAAAKPEQEKIILCWRLVQNAIVLWNYLYLSELLAKIDSQEVLVEMISVIRNGTAITWQHVNLLREYDFNKLQDNKVLRFDLERIFQFERLKDFDCREIKLINYGRPAVSIQYFVKHKYRVIKKVDPDVVEGILLDHIEQLQKALQPPSVGGGSGLHHAGGISRRAGLLP